MTTGANAPLPLKFDEHGLLPVVAQDHTTGAVLMVAWANAEAVARTRETGEAHFWSRSRGKLWRKGEESGNVLRVHELRVDCDGDTLLLLVDPVGPACHTGTTSCFYRTDAADGLPEDDGPRGAPAAIVDRLAKVMRARRDAATEEKSYTKSLFVAGMPKILAKIAEEHGELAAELAATDAPPGNDDKIVHEAADLLFHVLVGLTAKGIAPEQLWAELSRRFGTSGHVEKAARPPKPGKTP